MLLTLWCILLVCGSPLVIGAPLRWFLNRRQPFDAAGWIEASFLGISATILVLQNLAYLNLPLYTTAPLIWLLALIGWIAMIHRRQLVPLLATFPIQLYGLAQLAYLVQGAGMLIVGAKYYMGRAWGDQYNYTVLAQFLSDEPFNLALSEVGQRPYLVNALSLKDDRIGQSILHGFLTVSSGQAAKTLFEPTILLLPMLLVLALFSIATRLGMPRRAALVCGLLAGLLPSVASIHLESFLSQSLAVPLLLIFPVMLDTLAERPNWRYGLACGLIAAALTSIYTEFLAIQSGLVILILVGTGLWQRRWRQTAMLTIGVGLAPFVLNPFFIPGIMAIVLRIGLPALAALYPWAFTLEGFSRLWLGDRVSTPVLVWQIAIRAYTLAVTGLGMYGLARAVASQLGAAAEADPPPRAPVFAVSVLALALLPVLVILPGSDRPYQFYKLLLSFSPLFVIGLGYTLLELLPARPARAWALAVGFVLALVGVSSAAATLDMAIASTRLDQYSERYSAYYLLNADMRRLQDFAEGLHDRNIYFDQTDETWDTGFVNAWLSYFTRHNRIWLGNSHLSGTDVATIPEARDLLDLHALPTDILILTDRLRSEVPLPSQHSVIWSSDTYVLWQPDARAWLIPLAIDNPNGLEHAGLEPFYWIGPKPLSLRVIVRQAGQLVLTARFVPGPSLPGSSARRLLVTTDQGYRQTIALAGGEQQIGLPAEPGVLRVELQGLDQATVLQQPNGDTRTLLVGVQQLRIEQRPAP